MNEIEFAGKTLLLVDDRPENLQLLLGFLEKYDLNIIVAENGEQALERLQYTRPDMILLDIMMPGIDGYEVCRRLKESDEYSEIPIIFMSALEDPVDKVKGLELGAVDYITKPYKVEEVLARIRNQFHIQDLSKQLDATQEALKKPKGEQTEPFHASFLPSEQAGPGEITIKARTVLFVEDEISSRRMLKSFLDPYYYRTIFAQNYDETLQQLKENRPDIILLDVRLPGVDGFEICQRLKRSDDYKNIPVIFITALDDVADTVKGLEVGAVDYITKPYNNEELLGRISTHIKIRRLMQEKEQTNIRLKELDQLKSLFIASMSHEFRTPLNSITGFTGVLRMKLKGKLTAQEEDFFARIDSSSKHLLSLIDDIIDISKIEAGAIEASPEIFILNDVIDEAYGQLKKTIDDKGLEVNISVPPELEVFNDRTRFLQCLLNYLSNAVKFTDTGKVCLLVREMDEQIELVVEDTGVGISEKNFSQLFQPFERLSSSVIHKKPGTGLGLYLTKKLATEVLGGSVAVESQLGVGSKFYLRFSKKLISD
jgi:DNA-binding response OmpR family regulator